ncbi:MAG: hypothetical protein PHQ20_00160 [Candidatus Moranbacteria bacterium]|nr:hypothetical protein [Candidatus Moranbacteria bacterium]
MILPTKHINASKSLLGMGSEVLKLLENPRNVSDLWNRAKKVPEINTFEIFTLTLDFLFIIGVVEFKEGFLVKK